LSPSAFFARLSAAAATALFVAYAFTVASVALPLKLLDMGWQISVVNAIINNSTMPLEGVVLAHLAAYLDPSQPRFETFCRKLRSWAIPVTLGFLLIIPVQIYNFSKGLSNFNQSKANYERNVVQSFQNLRDVVISAPTVAELQKRLIELKGPPISQADSSLPLPVLRQNLLVVLQQVETNAKANSAINPDQIWTFGKDMIRSIFTSLAFAFAFSAAAKRSTWPDSLLAHFNRYLQSFRRLSFVNIGKTFEIYNAKRGLQSESKQQAERLRKHSAQVLRLKNQEEKEIKTRLKNLERLRSKDARNKRDND
jgi:hypothetical protein